MKTLVVSDLHVSCGALDDFDSELELLFISFLDQLETDTELVINGDFLDFVQADPWTGVDLESQTSDGIPLCFTEIQSCSKFGAIHAAHEKLFQALGRFLSRQPSNRLVIMPGNHDADFFWPKVQQLFRHCVAAGGQISEQQIIFVLSSCYIPEGKGHIWIEHGHQYDSVNRFMVEGKTLWSASTPPILTDEHGINRLYECTGTRFLLKYLNHLDRDYPFVDNVKPFSRFVKLFGASAFIPGYGPFKATLAICAMLRFISGTAMTRPSDFLSMNTAGVPSEAERLEQLLKRASLVRKQQFISELRDRGFLQNCSLEALLSEDRLSIPLFDFLAETPALLEALEPARENLLGLNSNKGMLTLRQGFAADESDELLRAARNIHRSCDSEVIIMGHTHEPLERRDGFRYINSGSWTRYFRFDHKVKCPSWELLRAGSFEDFPYQLYYVEIAANLEVTKVLFHERRTTI